MPEEFAAKLARLEEEAPDDADDADGPGEEPLLWPENVEAWLAFIDLSRSRPVGFGVGAIPLTEIEAWFRLHARAPDLWLVRKLAVLDMEFLTHQQELQTAKAGAGTPQHGPGRPPGTGPPPFSSGRSHQGRRR